jgi:hypothetical protein
MRPELEDAVPATKVAELMGLEWRRASSDLRGHSSWQHLLRSLRWEYVSRPGRAGSLFRRVHDV